MQLLHEHKPLMANIGVMNLNTPNRGVSSHGIEVKEKRSSDVALRQMNPVASGDNVTIDSNLGHKHKDELPMLVPCCEGKELQINQELVCCGLSAISMKHESVMQCLNMPSESERSHFVPGLVKHRNSFRSLHRPDLKRVSYLRRMTPDELELLFRGYADFPLRGAVAAENEATPRKALTLAEKFKLGDVQTRKTRQEDILLGYKVTIRAKRAPDGTVRATSDGRPAAEEVPAGMRLHGTRARLYTSILAGAKAGDQLDNASNAEDYDTVVPETAEPEEEVQMNEELQIILPPRCDDTAESVTTTTTVN